MQRVVALWQLHCGCTCAVLYLAGRFLPRGACFLNNNCNLCRLRPLPPSSLTSSPCSVPPTMPCRYVMPNVQAAQALSATLAAIFDVLNGFFIPRNLMPKWWRWAW